MLWPKITIERTAGYNSPLRWEPLIHTQPTEGWAVRFNLTTLLIAMGILPPFAAAWFYGDGPLEYICLTMIVGGVVLIITGAVLWASSFKAAVED